jgi:hypothetical protein
METREMTDLQQRMLDDLDWARRAPEVQGNPEHYGKTIVVYDRRILAVGKDSPALLEEAAKKAGVPWYHLVTLIVPRPGLWEIPH